MPLYATLKLAFLRHDLLRPFNIAATQLDGFARLAEGGYQPSNPYHNSLHAADALQAAHVIASRMDPAGHRKGVDALSFSGWSDSQSLSKLPGFFPGASAVSNTCGSNGIGDGGEGPPELFSAQDKLALFLAAALHDLRHPGVGLAHVVASGNSAALVLEEPRQQHYHAALARPLVRTSRAMPCKYAVTTLPPLLVKSEGDTTNPSIVEPNSAPTRVLPTRARICAKLKHSV